jgi:uncharacterized damage-inducible protein DinB
MWQAHFTEFAAYNRWVNRRLYDAASRLSDGDRKRDLGLFFRSLHGTLNHLVVADRIWLRRFTGEGPQPTRLNEIPYDDFDELRAAREAEDARIIAHIAALREDDFVGSFEYRTTSGVPHAQRRRDALVHFFNHQTHHRGQAHAALTILGAPEPAPFDLLAMQRG